MTVEQFESALQEFGEQLPTQLDADLLLIGGELVAQLKQTAPVDTGSLRASMQAVMQDHTLKIEMLYYGMFQNFGVSGANDSLGTTVPEGIMPRPSAEPNYQFGIRKTGIRARDFFNVDLMANQIALRLEEIVQSRLNNI
jgi:hypothetical protein